MHAVAGQRDSRRAAARSSSSASLRCSRSCSAAPRSGSRSRPHSSATRDPIPSRARAGDRPAGAGGEGIQLEVERHRRCSGCGATSGSGASRTRVSTPRGRPRPYGRDGHPPVAAGARPLAARSRSTRSPPTPARPVGIVAESEGVARRAHLPRSGRPAHRCARIVVLSPLLEPGRVSYPAPGRVGWGVAAGAALDASRRPSSTRSDRSKCVPTPRCSARSSRRRRCSRVCCAAACPACASSRSFRSTPGSRPRCPLRNIPAIVRPASTAGCSATTTRRSWSGACCAAGRCARRRDGRRRDESCKRSRRRGRCRVSRSRSSRRGATCPTPTTALQRGVRCVHICNGRADGRAPGRW